VFPGIPSRDNAPGELVVSVAEFWDESDQDAALAIAYLESSWNAFAIDDTTDANHPCGSFLRKVGDTVVTAELSIGYFQVNACNLPADWNPRDLVNARHNAGTAHMLWEQAGRSWSPWYFSARQLGLL